MGNPCQHCVQPERHPGCHDHCEKLKSYHESDDYQKLMAYKKKYFGPRTMVPSAQIDKAMRLYKKKGYSLHNFKLT